MSLMRSAIRRTRDLAFPARCGLATIRLDELLQRAPDLSIRLANWTSDPGAGSFWDLVTLAALVRAVRPTLCWEIGTGRGRGTAQIAANSPAECELYTLDISDAPQVGSGFASLPESAKVRRVVGDSMRYDFSSFSGRVELVLVDGSHDFDAVARDTQTALRLVSPRGVVLWHDFAPDWPGVVRALRQSPRRESLRRIAGTAYAFYGGPESIYPTGL